MLCVPAVQYMCIGWLLGTEISFKISLIFLPLVSSIISYNNDKPPSLIDLINIDFNRLRMLFITSAGIANIKARNLSTNLNFLKIFHAIIGSDVNGILINVLE